MREIKFRAWLIGSERMLHDVGFDGSSSIANEVVEYMQYTGLKDKNGVEIYEGDIVQYEIHTENYSSQGDDSDLIDHVVGEVIIGTRGVQIKIPNGKYQRDVLDGGDYQTPPDYSHSVPIKGAKWPLTKSRAKVIGNIHDNPELMK